MPWAGNIAKTMTSNGKQFTVTREMLTAVARDQRWSDVVAEISALFSKFAFVLLSNKSLNDCSLGEQSIMFPSNLNASRETKLTVPLGTSSIIYKAWSTDRLKISILATCRGALKYNIKAYSLAVKDLTEAVAIDCKCSLAYFNRAVCYHEMRFFQKVSTSLWDEGGGGGGGKRKLIGD